MPMSHGGFLAEKTKRSKGRFGAWPGGQSSMGGDGYHSTMVYFNFFLSVLARGLGVGGAHGAVNLRPKRSLGL